MIKSVSLSFKNRIAFNYIVSSAILIAFVFLFIFQIVKFGVNKHVNEELYEELQKHLEDVKLDSNNTYLIQVDQWRAREHNTISVNPVFVQFYDNNKQVIDKSPNLKNENLHLLENSKNDLFLNDHINGTPIRQIQKAILNQNKIVGYVVVAMSLEDFQIVEILKKVLLILFPIVLLILFLIARFFAGKSIQPIATIINTSNQITKDNLNVRIPLPDNKDELYTLSDNINQLLNRIENAIEREKQFTSDASHELRTPLAVVKGTLEVLVRKPRTAEEYNEKINFCIQEVDRINNLVDQLLLLARFENQKQNIKTEKVYLEALILDALSLFSSQLKEKEIKVTTNLYQNATVNSDSYLLSIILTNIISNAIKYTKPNGNIKIELIKNNDKLILEIADNGIGISETELSKIFNSFYRVNATNHPEIKGTGIGLSIVKRLCDLLDIKIAILSKINKGTSVKLHFNTNNPK